LLNVDLRGRLDLLETQVLKEIQAHLADQWDLREILVLRDILEIRDQQELMES
jgi:hypothetical protein